MNALFLKHILVIVFTCISTSFLYVRAHPVHTPTLHVFGDSLSDIGRLRNLTFGFIPPKAYWDGRFSSGPVWNEYLALLLNYKLENHAVGSAEAITTQSKSLVTFFASPPTTNVQIGELALQMKPPTSTYGKPVVDKMDIAILEIGSNDAQAALADVANNRQTIYEFAQSLSDTVVQQLELLSEIGFKRIFVTNLPSLQHAPIVKSKNRAPLAEVAVSFYNRILAEKVMKWKAKAQLDSVTILDFESFVNNAIKPSVTNALGISDIESYCVGGKWLAMFEDQLEYAEILKFLLEFGNKNTCADSATKFFFDPIHPSERVHRLFGYYVHMVIAGQGTGTQFVLSEKSLLELIDKYKLDSKVSKPAAI